MLRYVSLCVGVGVGVGVANEGVSPCGWVWVWVLPMRVCHHVGGWVCGCCQ